MESKPSAKAPLFVILSWFAPLLMWCLKFRFEKMGRDFFWKHFSRPISDYLAYHWDKIKPPVRNLIWDPVNKAYWDHMNHILWQYELASFLALVSALIFGVVCPLVAFWRREAFSSVAIFPFLFWFWAIGVFLIMVFGLRIMGTYPYDLMGHYDLLFPNRWWPPPR